MIALRNDSVPEVASDGETDFMVESLEEMAAAVDRVGDLDPRAMRGQGRAAVLGRGHEGRLRVRLPGILTRDDGVSQLLHT